MGTKKFTALKYILICREKVNMKMKRNITLIKLFYLDTPKEVKEKSALTPVIFFFSKSNRIRRVIEKKAGPG